MSAEEHEKEKILSVSGLAKLMRVSNITIYRAVEAGQLPHYRVGKTIRFNRDEVMSATRQAVR